MRGSTDGKRLAIEGGAPVRSVALPYGRHEIEEDDVRAVEAVLRSGWLTTGPAVEAFEEAFAQAVGARYAVSFSSGTAALHGALAAAGISAGNTVITTPLTFCATANAALYLGATPVFADVRPDTLNLDPERVRAQVDASTAAIVAVDFAGHPCELDRLREIADAHGLTLIEDASHALGARYRGRPVGSIADLTTFSLHPVKHVAAGEGGVVTTADPAHVRDLRRFRNHGIDVDFREREARGSWAYEMVELGMNYRLNDLSCALARSQLRRLDRNLARRRALAARYTEALAALPALELPPVGTEVEPAWHLYPVRLDPARLDADRDQVIAALKAEGIGAGVHYRPVHLHRYYRERFGERPGLAPIAEEAWTRLVSLPLFHGMTGRDRDDVIAAVGKVIEHYAHGSDPH